MSKELKASLFLLELIKRSNKIFRSKSIVNTKKEIAQKIKTDAYENRIKGLYEQVKIKREKLIASKAYFKSEELSDYIKDQELASNNLISNLKKRIVEFKKEDTQINNKIKKNINNKNSTQKIIKELKSKIDINEKEIQNLKKQLKEQKEKEIKSQKLKKQLKEQKESDKEISDIISNDSANNALAESFDYLYNLSHKLTKDKLSLNDLAESKAIFSMLVPEANKKDSEPGVGEDVFIKNLSTNLTKFGRFANDSIIENENKILKMTVENSQMENEEESSDQELAILEEKDAKSSSGNIGGANFYVSFSDIISVLLCFFILFFAMGKIDGDKAKKLASTFTEKTIKKKQVFNAFVSPDEFKMLEKVKQLMLDNVKPEDIIGSKTKTVSHILSGSDLFYPGETELSEDGIDLLRSKFNKDDLGTVKELIIEGHTDDKEFYEFPEISKNYKNNTQLSAVRAIKVVELIKKNLGLSSENIGIRAYGANRPLKPNSTDLNRAHNRRVEIKITTEIKEAINNQINSKTIDNSNSKEIKEKILSLKDNSKA